VSLRTSRAHCSSIVPSVAWSRDMAGVRRRSEARRSHLRWPFLGGAGTVKFVSVFWFERNHSRIPGRPESPSPAIAAVELLPVNILTDPRQRGTAQTPDPTSQSLWPGLLPAWLLTQPWPHMSVS
jgi:hypothetical protein